jgi:hypothetical protein
MLNGEQQKKQLMWLKAEEKVEIIKKSKKEIIWKRKT